MKRTLLMLALALQAAACVTARAQVQPEDRPALVVPPVPPRVIDPLPPEPPPIEPVGELPTAPVNPPRARPPAREPNRTSTSESKPAESKPPDTPPVDPAAGTQTTPAPPPVQPLRTPGTSDGPEMAKQVRETLDRANRTLNGIDYQALKPDSRANYDNAKSFIKQAEDALKANNLVVAKLLAERAENIAKQLS